MDNPEKLIYCLRIIGGQYAAAQGIKELTPEILRTVIQKIVIHNREQKHTKKSPQQIDICHRYLGNLADVSEPEQENTVGA